MDTRDPSGVGDPPVVHGPVPVVVQRPPELALQRGDDPVRRPRASDDDVAEAPGRVPRPRRSRRRPVLLVAAVVLLALIGAAALVLSLRGGDDVSAVPGETPGAGAVAPVEEGLRLILPPEVVAGVPAQVVVRYAGGAGAFGGATEEWGDGVGAGSQSAPGCAGTAGGSGDQSGGPTPGEAGTYRTSHLWAEPGTYPVTISVTTYTCVDGVAKETTATASVPVTVVAPSP